MLNGKWLEPRYTDKTVFEKDYAKIDLSGMDVYCPGCRKSVKLARKSPIQRIAGWCRACNRGVTA